MTLLALPSLADLTLMGTEKTEKHECGSFPSYLNKREETQRLQMNGGVKPVDDKFRQCRNVC